MRFYCQRAGTTPRDNVSTASCCENRKYFGDRRVREIAQLDRTVVSHALKEDPEFAKIFMHFILQQNQKLQADVIDQLSNSIEKRLARILLTLANIGMGSESNTITMAIDREMLASMVRTTRSRINRFVSKFRKLRLLRLQRAYRSDEFALEADIA